MTTLNQLNVDNMTVSLTGHSFPDEPKFPLHFQCFHQLKLKLNHLRYLQLPKVKKLWKQKLLEQLILFASHVLI